ncbi:MAG: TetR/AcrR family transcriptional regulator [Planctomycetes bacterium]|nr:TetR/AcrR family transcriptional regulator [Planctomycetota bacterium]
MPSRPPSKANAAKEEAILREAVCAFARDGFRGTDVQEIADRAGVGKGTVYRYFHEKQELFWATVYWVLEKLDSHLAHAMAGEQRALEKLRASCHAYGEFFETNPEYLEIFVLDRAEFRGKAPESHLERHEEMIRKFSTIIEEGIERHEIRPLDPRQTVLALASTLYGSVVHAAYAKFDRPVSELAATATEIFLRGIAAESISEGEQV